jgi:hypothetical protein
MRIFGRKFFYSVTASLVLLTATLAIVSAATHLVGKNKRRPPIMTSRAPNADLPGRTRKVAQMESELITVTPQGFEPREITRPNGAFLLMIDNRSGLTTIQPQLKSTTLVRLLDITLPREEPDWSQVVNLQPGIYLLTESNHPTWVFRLTITQ